MKKLPVVKEIIRNTDSLDIRISTRSGAGNGPGKHEHEHANLVFILAGGCAEKRQHGTYERRAADLAFLHAGEAHETIFTTTRYLSLDIKPTALAENNISEEQPKDEFPLRGVLKCWCGKNMTTGYSKGKRKYYLYYRCIEHTETNIPGELIHEKFEYLLDTLSFTKAQVTYIISEVKKTLLELDKNRDSDIRTKSKQLAEAITKLEKLEKRLMDDVIDHETYKKWFKSYSVERSELSDQLAKLKQGISNIRFERLIKLLPEITRLKSLYQRAPLHRKQNLIRGVFKHSLMWVDGAFRTPSIEPCLTRNLLNVNEKGLLF